MEDTVGIECALWPSLYPYRSWCDTVVAGSQTRASQKMSFITKVLSCIPCYSLEFELLHFHYDKWIFKTVTGAITTARRFKCSPARSLDDKTFSLEYWRWQHRVLLDAVTQYGLPSVFVTISPYEWTFPFPSWVSGVRQATGKGPTELAGYETLHIAHTLEQIVRGYLTGSNNASWSQHVFSYNASKTFPNVLTYFYRFEFQSRGTVHLHLLVGLKKLSVLNFKNIRADIPCDNPELASLVEKLRKSDKRSPFLTLEDKATYA